MDPLKVISDLFVSSEKRILSDNMPVLVRRGTRSTLAYCFRELGYNRGVEVGTRYGYYAMELCKANPNLHLTCVDPWLSYNYVRQKTQDEIYAAAIENLKPYNVTIDRRKSMEAIGDYEEGSFDFAYVDGAHDFDNAVSDIIYWSPRVRSGGIVAVHDYMAGHGAGVMKAVDAYAHCHRIYPWFVTRESEPTAFWIKP